jgi:predicted transcriptional regulator
MGRPRRYDEPTVRTAVRLPPDLIRRLREVADERDTDVNHLIVKAAAKYLDRLFTLDALPPFGPGDGT